MGLNSTATRNLTLARWKLLRRSRFARGTSLGHPFRIASNKEASLPTTDSQIAGRRGLKSPKCNCWQCSKKAGEKKRTPSVRNTLGGGMTNDQRTNDIETHVSLDCANEVVNP